jgi:hypothetical protein
MDNEEEAPHQLSCCGWLTVENIERMLDHKFLTPDICDALNLPSEHHMNYLLARAAAERHHLLWEVNTDES